MAIKKAKRTKDISVESYSHKGKKRKNNPPVGLVSSATDRLNGRTKYQHDPHLDPVRKHAPLFMMSYKTICKWCSISVSNGVDPRLVYAGKAEHTSKLVLSGQGKV